MSTDSFKVKPQYATNPYIKNIFDKENVNVWLGLTSNKTGDEILEYVRERKSQISENILFYKEELSKLSKFFNRKKYDEISTSLLKCETAMKELDNLEDFITNFYQRVVDSEWGKKFLDNIRGLE